MAVLENVEVMRNFLIEAKPGKAADKQIIATPRPACVHW